MSSPLKNNTTTLQSILDTINALPEAGTDLPELTNPADASKALSGYEFINGDGEKVTGTIPTKTASNLTASGATVTVPAGYYASQATKSVATATQATPSVSIDSAGKITATATQTAGYVSAGTKTGTKQLTTQAAKTVTPSTSSQTAVAKNVYTTGAVTVAAIPSTYVKPSYTKAAATYTPTTANQTISAGTYLTGAQTIKGDSNLVAGNIKSGVSIFGVEGNYEGIELNFDVIRYDTEEALLAATPAENTIGVITTTPITSWSFSATAPASPAEGMVWFIVDTSSNAEFNALKKNAIQVYPLSAKQYVSGAWGEVTTMTHLGGEWVKWLVDTYVYNAGNQYTDITGGWKAVSDGGAVATFDNDRISLSITSSSNRVVAIYTNNKIDVSKYKTLVISTKIISSASANVDYVYIGLADSNTDSTTASWVVQNTINGIGEHEAQVNIENITGSFYVAVRTNKYNAEVYEIKLKV